MSVDGRLAEDVLCIECGYNLRGLRPDGKCPECGNDVAPSLRGLKLETASLPWLRSIRRGFVLLRYYFLASLVLVLVPVPLGMLLSTLPLRSPSVHGLLALLFGGLLCGVLPVAACGFLLATRVEPRVAWRGEGWSARRLARILTVVTLGLWAGLWLAEELLPPSKALDFVVMYLPLALPVLGALAVAALVDHVIALLERTAEEKAQKGAKETRKYVLAAVVFGAGVALINAIVPLFGPSSEIGNRIEKAGEVVSCAHSCVTILFVIGALQLVWRVARILDRTVAAAEHMESSTQGA